MRPHLVAGPHLIPKPRPIPGPMHPPKLCRSPGAFGPRPWGWHVPGPGPGIWWSPGMRWGPEIMLGPKIRLAPGTRWGPGVRFGPGIRWAAYHFICFAVSVLHSIGYLWYRAWIAL